MPSSTDGTYVEDVKDPLKVLLPSGNRIFVVLCVEYLRGRVSFTQFDDLLLDPDHGPTPRTQ